MKFLVDLQIDLGIKMKNLFKEMEIHLFFNLIKIQCINVKIQIKKFIVEPKKVLNLDRI